MKLRQSITVGLGFLHIGYVKILQLQRREQPWQQNLSPSAGCLCPFSVCDCVQYRKKCLRSVDG